jgi:hypothetical protein
VQQKAGENANEIFENTVAGSSGGQSRNVIKDSQELPKSRWSNG